MLKTTKDTQGIELPNMEEGYKMFPIESWQSMDTAEQDFFREMTAEDLRDRWHSPEGKTILGKIIEINLGYGSSDDYSEFIGKIKVDWGKNIPKFDLRGINFSEYSNLIDDEYFGFDFSNCLLYYSNFSDTIFSSSNFANSDILYSDFSNSTLDDCDFSNSNLTLSNFDDTYLEHSNFSSTWMSSVSFENADLGYIQYNRKTDFHNIDIGSVKGSSNPMLISDIRKKQYLKHFKAKNTWNNIVYYIWLVISDCGQSFSRWFVSSIVICLLFGFIYSSYPESFFLANDRIPTGFTFYYFSVINFTTLGFGDIVPKDLWGEIVVTIEVIVGYMMLGGLISIISTKFIPRG